MRNTAARTVCAIRAALEAAVFRPQTGYYSDISEEAAALLESLVNNHAFVDGNKRVGFAALHTFLLVNGFDLDVSSKAALRRDLAVSFRFGYDLSLAY